MKQIRGMIYTEQFRFEPGILTVEEDIIKSVERCNEAELRKEEAEQYVIPGLVDIHFHGCAGYDFCDGTKEAILAISEYELSKGITTICPATMTLSKEKLIQICHTAADAQMEHMKGIYLEGPFVSYEKRGAQNPEYIRKADLDLLDELQKVSGGLIKVVAIAPEEEGALECIRDGSNRYRFSIAHTCADYDTAKAAIQAGVLQVTHLYNAMPPFSHRAPGVIGAAAEETEVAVELICDGIHVHPSVVRSTFKLFGDERVILISDSMMATGMQDGSYALGGQKVEVKGKLALLENGTIAGSVTNLFECMCHAVEMGIPKESAIRAATINPARAIGIDGEFGSLQAGKKADILILNRDFSIQKIMKSGKNIKSSFAFS